MEYIKGLLVPVRGEIRRVAVKNELKALQKTVGGHIQTLKLAEGVVLICNEEGKAAEAGTEHAFLYHQWGFSSGRREWG